MSLWIYANSHEVCLAMPRPAITPKCVINDKY